MRELIASPLGRVAGSVLSWFFFALWMTLLLKSAYVLLAIGGSCASGGPYEIAVPCPDSVALFMPLSIFGGLAAAAIGLFVARGFGTQLVALAWPILFGSLGTGFFYSFFAFGDISGIVVGVVFAAMALVPLVVFLRASPQRVFLGAYNLRGERFYEGETPRFSMIDRRYEPGEAPVRADFGDWALSLVLWLLSAGAGYYVATLWFAAV